MSIPPDQPTRPLPPATPPLRTDRAPLAAEELLWRDEIRSQLRSLTVALTVAIVVAFVALGVSIWALLGASGDDGRPGSERVQALQQRVARLERLVTNAADRDAVAALQQQQRTLADRVAALGDAAAQPTGDLEPLQAAIDGTQQAVDQLDERITALEQTSPSAP